MRLLERGILITVRVNHRDGTLQEREVHALDLSYDPELKAFRYVSSGRMHVILREHVIGFRERNPVEDD